MTNRSVYLALILIVGLTAGASCSWAESMPSQRSATFDPMSRNAPQSAVLEEKLLPSPDGLGGEESLFGLDVAIDGNHAVVGSDMGLRGAVVFLEATAEGWVERQIVEPAADDPVDVFGRAVSISGDRALVGATGTDDFFNDVSKVYVYERVDGVWQATDQLTPADKPGDIDFAADLSLDGDRAIVGAPRGDGGRGAAYIFEFDGLAWQQTARLTASDSNSGDRFGRSVSLQNDRILIGSPLDDTADSDAGSAYIFDLVGPAWTESAKVLASDAGFGDSFGSAVSLWGDRILVGAPNDDESGTDSGSAYIFDLDNGIWSQTAKLLADNGNTNDGFGNTISLFGDVALIGASRSDATAFLAGSAYIFAFDGLDWNQTASLSPSTHQSLDRLGYAVALSNQRALVGAFSAARVDRAAGAAYVFEQNGANWIETDEIQSPEGAARDRFGLSVSLSGNRALVGAHQDDDNGFDSGAAYVFEKDGASWNKTAKLLPSDGSPNSHFGQTVVLQGNRALVGAPESAINGSISGAVYVFDFDGDAWIETTILTPSDAGAGQAFGFSISLDGNRALISAPGDAELGATAGAVYLFTLENDSWTESEKLLAFDGESEDWFGYSVSLSGERALIGAPQDDDHGADSGAAYIFDLATSPAAPPQKLTNSNSIAGRRFGWSVSILDDRAMVGSYWDLLVPFDRGAAYIFEFEGSDWQETSKLLPPQFEPSGPDAPTTVALAPNSAFIGHIGYIPDREGVGAVVVFPYNEGIWQAPWMIRPDDASGGDLFGLSLSADSGRVLIGASGHDFRVRRSGAAYIYSVDGPALFSDGFEQILP